MSKFEVTILGSSSAAPTLSRNPTSQLVNINEKYYLIDCGEGTQLQLRKYKIKFQRIHHIFISHLHGDHYLGLIGLIQTFHLLGRVKDLHIYANEKLAEIIAIHLKCAQTTLNYKIIYHNISYDKPTLIYENKRIEVSTIILKHRIPCTGFLFKEKIKSRSINPKALLRFNIPKYAINKIKAGNDYVADDGKIIKHNELTCKESPSFSYAFCSDTKYMESIIPTIQGVSLLYHEATFMEEHADRANKTLHSTAKQAATIL